MPTGQPLLWEKLQWHWPLPRASWATGSSGPYKGRTGCIWSQEVYLLPRWPPCCPRSPLPARQRSVWPYCSSIVGATQITWPMPATVHRGSHQVMEVHTSSQKFTPAHGGSHQLSSQGFTPGHGGSHQLTEVHTSPRSLVALHPLVCPLGTISDLWAQNWARKKGDFKQLRVDSY